MSKFVFIFLWENHDVVKLGLQSRVTQSLDLPWVIAFFKEANSAKFGPGLRPVRGGVESYWVRFYVFSLEQAN